MVFWFTVVPHNDGVLVHHLDVCPFLDRFGFPYILGPFLRSDEELVLPREVEQIFEVYIVNFDNVIFQVHDSGAYILGFYYPPPMLLTCVLSPRYIGLYYL